MLQFDSYLTPALSLADSFESSTEPCKLKPHNLHVESYHSRAAAVQKEPHILYSVNMP